VFSQLQHPMKPPEATGKKGVWTGVDNVAGMLGLALRLANGDLGLGSFGLGIALCGLATWFTVCEQTSPPPQHPLLRSAIVCLLQTDNTTADMMHHSVT